MRYLAIEEMKPSEHFPDKLEKRYGLVDTSTCKVVLPLEYSYIKVMEEGGFVWTERKNNDFTDTYEVYEILENGELKLVPEDEPTDFVCGISNNANLMVMRINGKIRVIRDLHKSFY